MTLGVPGAPEPRMYPRSGYFLVCNVLHFDAATNKTLEFIVISYVKVCLEIPENTALLLKSILFVRK